MFDGQTGALLYTSISPHEEAYGHFGWCVSDAGNVNGDGYDDVVVGAFGEDPGSSPSGAGRGYVFDGQTGSSFYTLVSPNEQAYGYFGYSVSGAGDVNGDGCDDVVVGAYGEDPGSGRDGAGRAYVFSGQTGDVLHALVSPNEESSGNFGHSVSGAGDVDGDGRGDVVIGAYGEDPGSSPSSAGRCYVFDGQTGSLLHTLVSPNEETDGYFGFSVSGAGDVNGDGYDDVVVGAYREDPGSSPEDAGRAYVYDGHTGHLLHTLVTSNEQYYGYFGNSVSGAGDVNGDGYDDVVVGAVWEDPGSYLDAGQAYVFDGQTGSLLLALVSPNEEGWGGFGVSVSGTEDVNGDGYDDVVVGAFEENPGSSPQDAGRAYVFDGFLIPVELVGFTASVEEKAVVLRWTTLSEHENFGFHVYRSRESAGEYLCITDAIIPGAGTSGVKYDYSYADDDVLEGCYYSYKLADIDFQGHETLHGPASVMVLPAELVLHGAYPNPFSSETTGKLHLSAKGHVRVSVYDIAGRRVRMLVDEEMEAGQHEIGWDGRDDSSVKVSPGVYTFSAQSDDRECFEKLIRIR
jgi:hypothetical protein